MNFLNWNTEGLLSKPEDVDFIVYVHILFYYLTAMFIKMLVQRIVHITQSSSKTIGRTLNLKNELVTDVKHVEAK